MFWPKKSSSEHAFAVRRESPSRDDLLPESFTPPEIREGNGDADWALWARCSAEVEELARIHNRRKRTGAVREHAA